MGCGSGKLLTEVLSHQTPKRLVGVDLSDEFIDLAKKEAQKTARAGFKRPLFAQADMHTLAQDHPDWVNSYDLVLSGVHPALL